MQRFFEILWIILITLSVGNAASASYFDAVDGRDVWIPVEISYSEFGPDEWFEMGSVDNPFPSDYNPSEITSFTITLSGEYASNDDIDIFLDFDNDHTDNNWVYVQDYTPPDSNFFSITLDIFKGDLLFNGVDTGQNLSNVNLNSFVNTANQDAPKTFWVAYGCYFKHLQTEAHIERSAPIPEPATLFLFGSGLIGLAGLGRRKFFKKS